ncbi:unnamed protein product [Gordionus sp. m RMFG-2023]
MINSPIQNIYIICNTSFISSIFLFGGQLSKNLTKTDIPVIWIQAGTHAREWISISTALCLISKILKVLSRHNDYDHKNDVFRTHRLVSSYRFTFIPLINPDGYEYSRKVSRLWRKNRFRHKNCTGVDLNRNWGYLGNESSFSMLDEDVRQQKRNINSNHKCSILYSGPYPFSEFETSLIANYARKLPNIKAALELHNPGQMIIYPWGWTKQPTPDNDLQEFAARKMAETIYNTTGEHYVYGQISQLLYKAPGNSIDWFYGALGIKYSYGIELRDKGKEGFLVSSNKVRPTCKEIFKALLALLDIISKRDRVIPL